MIIRITRRKALLLSALAAPALLRPRRAFAQDVVRIGLPTKTYWPTIVTQAAVTQKLFEKEGIGAEPTVYRGGAEAFEALAAGAADIVLDAPALTAAGIRKGVASKVVAGGATGYMGWHLLVRSDSPITAVDQLRDKKVGITSAGSGSDLLAQWTIQNHKISFTRVPLGGGGLVPNLLSRNVDAAVVYSPLSFQMMQAGQARSLIDYFAAVPPHLAAGWIATDRLIADNPAMVQKSLNALFGGLAWLRANRAPAITLIAEVDEITPQIAEAEYEATTLKLSTDGAMPLEHVEAALELSKLGGMTDLAPAADIFTTRFKPVPTT